MHAHARTCAHMRAHVRTCTHMLSQESHMCQNMHTHTHTYTHTQTHTHHAHTYTHIHTDPRLTYQGGRVRNKFVPREPVDGPTQGCVWTCVCAWEGARARVFVSSRTFHPNSVFIPTITATHDENLYLSSRTFLPNSVFIPSITATHDDYLYLPSRTFHPNSVFISSITATYDDYSVPLLNIYSHSIRMSSYVM